MTEKIYGNSFALQTFSSMFRSGRIPHSFLIYGEKGLGKKTLAKYLAMSLLCENRNDGTPCGECHSCRIAQKNVHPDIIFPEQSGKLNTYTVETCRHVCTDAFVVPNNSDIKIYIFADADNIQLPAQNALLKIIEEPPAHVRFIFTAKSKDAFLPTIISRVTSVGASACTEKECITALSEKNYSDTDIKNAVNSFGSNIGMCIEYMENPQLQSVSALTKRAVNSIINKDEYSLLTVFSDPEFKDRSITAEFLKMLDNAIRDCVAIRYNPNISCSSCCKPEVSVLSEKLSVKSAMKIHTYLDKAASEIRANVSSALVMSALCGEIIDS
ncbi:MAG: DNA polymerase III subunit delta' [Oscillospiraceae bacterium]|nr:DNA polymerase III subunit delta' [Oscillospiraceae bacterium]